MTARVSTSIFSNALQQGQVTSKLGGLFAIERIIPQNRVGDETKGWSSAAVSAAVAGASRSRVPVQQQQTPGPAIRMSLYVQCSCRNIVENFRPAFSML